MPEGILIAAPEAEFELKRRPVAHRCVKCGFTENIVPPCGKGVAYWSCSCGTKYRMEFAGVADQCGESIAKGAG